MVTKKQKYAEGMAGYTQWWIDHPWHVTPGAVVPDDCDCGYCRKKRNGWGKHHTKLS